MIDSSIKYELPNMIDLDNDPVTVSLNIDNGIKFVSLSTNDYSLYSTGTITINPLSSKQITPGTYTAVFDLNDSKEITKYNLSIEVYANTRDTLKTVLPSAL